LSLDRGKYPQEKLSQLTQNLNTRLVDIGQIVDDTNLVQAKKFSQSLDGRLDIKVNKNAWQVRFSIAFTFSEFTRVVKNTNKLTKVFSESQLWNSLLYTQRSIEKLDGEPDV
jgi:hypothetical protein